jgi:predicted nucleic acid-binding protein
MAPAARRTIVLWQHRADSGGPKRAVTRVVVDASVAVKWFLPEEFSMTARMLLAADYQLLAPDLLWAELGNVLWKRQRRGELGQRTAMRLFRDFSRLPIEFHAAERWTEEALALAMRQAVTVYDGLYLALAAGNECRVVTADRRLYELCEAGALAQTLVWVGDIGVAGRPWRVPRSLFLTGPNLTTLPVQIYNYIEYTSDPTIAAISVVLIVFTSLVVLITERIVGFGQFVW